MNKKPKTMFLACFLNSGEVIEMELEEQEAVDLATYSNQGRGFFYQHKGIQRWYPEHRIDQIVLSKKPLKDKSRSYEEDWI